MVEEWVFGLMLSVVGNVMINLSANLIKLHHNRVRANRPDSRRNSNSTNTRRLSTGSNISTGSLASDPGDFDSYVTSVVFWIGVTFFISGNTLNFISFAYAAQSLLAALGSIQFVSNVIFLRVLLKLPVERSIIYATFTIVVGNTVIVLYGSHEEQDFTTEDFLALYGNPWYIAYLCVCSVIVGVGGYMYFKMKQLRRLPENRNKFGRLLPVTYVLASGAVGSQSVLLAKCMSLIIGQTLDGNNQFGYAFTYVICGFWLLTMSFWIRQMNQALRMFEAVFIIPLLQVVWTLFSIVEGGIYFKEFNTFSLTQAFMFSTGVLIVCVGMFFLAPNATNGPGRSRLNSVRGSARRSRLPSQAVNNDYNSLDDVGGPSDVMILGLDGLPGAAPTNLRPRMGSGVQLLPGIHNRFSLTVPVNFMHVDSDEEAQTLLARDQDLLDDEDDVVYEGVDLEVNDEPLAFDVPVNERFAAISTGF